MNERIRELAEQSTEVSEWLSGNCSPDAPDLEKFAELIVGECFDCIDIMEKIANSSNASIPESYDKYTYLKTLDDLKGLLKVHFGGESNE